MVHFLKVFLLNTLLATSGIAAYNPVQPVNQGGTGQTSFTNGQLLIGNTTGNTLTKSTLTAGTGVSITNSTGSITISIDGVAPSSGCTAYTSTGTFTHTVSAGKNYVTGIVVGGGGGGGGGNVNNVECGAGGGGGSVYFFRAMPVVPGEKIKGWVGAGGAHGTDGTSQGNPGAAGDNSSFGPYFALGGGGGNGHANSSTTGRGNSGGAALSSTTIADFNYTTQSTSSTPVVASMTGFFSGSASAGTLGDGTCGGGGGAGANATAASGTTVGGIGGGGVSVTINGSTVEYGCGGGGGKVDTGGTQGTGGCSNAGNGGVANSSPAPTSGTANTGGGGGGQGRGGGSSSGNGGSGTVIVCEY